MCRWLLHKGPVFRFCPGEGPDLLLRFDFSFAEVIEPAVAMIGKDNWGRVFSNIYVVDDKAFAHVAKE